MRRSPTAIQCVAIWAMCGVASGLVGYPRGLPAVLQTGVDRAVDATSSVWLWLWDQPRAVARVEIEVSEVFSRPPGRIQEGFSGPQIIDVETGLLAGERVGGEGGPMVPAGDDEPGVAPGGRPAEGVPASGPESAARLL